MALKIKAKTHRPQHQNINALRGVTPPMWNVVEFPLREYESHVQLVPYLKHLDCPTGDGGHLVFQERTGTLRDTAGNQICCVHSCSKCHNFWGIQSQQYPREVFYFAGAEVKMRPSGA